ncbi:ORF6N domain-containing protein [Algoriphagus formosus]|uniref:ORF6N domain-containing protein n=1 Tax=Algoriphagus formosus TaxID=2007308 RepID=UPI000C2942AC|nr:ORF6N domain-containing protein [Algoriphagus formosus]
MMNIPSKQEIENQIHTVRGQQVMLDSDLAVLYGTETKFINRAVKRNQERFPVAFAFQLSEKEWSNLKFQIGTSTSHGGRRTVPTVFTEQGIAMLSAVLKTETAIQVSIQIIQAFVEMRRFLGQNATLFQRLDQLEIKQIENDKKFDQLFHALEKNQLSPEKGIFFNGQIFDAYVFLAKLIKKPKEEIIIIDNYLDESVLILLSKCSPGVSITFYTKEVSNKLKLDFEKFTQQYPNASLKLFSKSHDRFIIIDKSELYHFGASLKDLGKKWFAFSRMDDFTDILMNELEREL